MDIIRRGFGAHRAIMPQDKAVIGCHEINRCAARNLYLLKILLISSIPYAYTNNPQETRLSEG